MKYKFRIAIILLCLFTIGIFAYYKFNAGKKITAKDIKIGLSLDSLVVERWQTDRDIFVAKVKQLGGDVIVQSANNDTVDQIDQIKFLISQKIDVLVVIAHDSDALSNIISKAKRQGIKVIAYDRPINKADVDLYISFDNTKVGELMAETLKSKVPKGNYIIINGSKEDYNTHYVNQGFKKYLSPEIQNGDIKIISEVWANSWKEEDAYNCVEDAILKGKKIDAIMCGNDTLAEAAIKALSERRLAGSVYIAGQDAALSGCQSIVEGTQTMTVYKPIRILAQEAGEYAIKLAKGEKINTNSKISDGVYTVPFQMETPISVNKNNMMDIVVKDNFHSKEEIYRNLPLDQWPKEQK